MSRQRFSEKNRRLVRSRWYTFSHGGVTLMLLLLGLVVYTAIPQPAYAQTVNPTLLYTTYLGGSATDAVADVAVDGAGNIYLTGWTQSTDFWTAGNPVQPSNAGGQDAFVVKLNPAGDTVLYATYLGGSGDDTAYGLAVDGTGNVYVVGETTSSDFPVTAGAFQTTFGGVRDGFVAKLDSTGQLVYATYLGGSLNDYLRDVALDASGNAHVVGWSWSSDYPVTANAYQSIRKGGWDAVVSKLNTSGNSLLYSTYFGGSSVEAAQGIAVDAAGRIYIDGETASWDLPTTSNAFQPNVSAQIPDAFIARFSADGSTLEYATYLGGTGGPYANGYSDYSGPIAVDSAGNFYATGTTYSTNFPTVKPVQPSLGGAIDGFIAKFRPDGTPVYITYVGGSQIDGVYDIVVNDAGEAFLIGTTLSADFPTTANALDTTLDGGSDVFIMQLAADGSTRLLSTLLGGTAGENGNGIALHGTTLYAAGSTTSTDFPLGQAATPLQPSNQGQNDGFLARIALANTPPTALDDSATTDEDVPVTIPVLANDTDVDGDPLTLTNLTQPANGSVVDNGDGTVTYTPNANWFGTDSFTYTANDGALDSNVATVTVTVNPVNDAPVAQAGGPYAATEGASIRLDGSGSYDIDGSIVLFEWDVNNDGIFGNATGPTSTVVLGDNGVFPIALRVTDDGGASSIMTTTVDVANLPPTGAIEAAAAVQFPDGLALMARMGVTTTIQAAATDPGSDDLSFIWSTGDVHTYYNDGLGPDPALSAQGIFPFPVTDTIPAMWTTPGVHNLTLTVQDDDGGMVQDTQTILVTGAETCRQDADFWKKQFDGDKHKEIDSVILQGYLDVVAYASGMFPEQVPMESAMLNKLLKGKELDQYGKLTSRLLVAWLNFAAGSIAPEEVFGKEDQAMAFLQGMRHIEQQMLAGSMDKAQRKAAEKWLKEVNRASDCKNDKDAKENEQHDREDKAHSKASDMVSGSTAAAMPHRIFLPVVEGQ